MPILSSPPITVAFDAVPASRVCEAIARQTKRHLSVEASIGKEMVAVEFTKLPFKVAMDTIAIGLNATWSRSGVRWHLRRTPAQLVAEEKHRKAILAEGYRRTLNQFRSVDPFNAGMRSMIRFRAPLGPDLLKPNATVEERTGLALALLHARLIRCLSPEVIVSMTDEKLVFSNHPNPAQEPLTQAQQCAFTDFIKEIRALPRAPYETRIPDDPKLIIVLDRYRWHVTLRFVIESQSGSPIWGMSAEDIYADLNFGSNFVQRASKTSFPEMRLGVAEWPSREVVLNPLRYEPLQPAGKWLRLTARRNRDQLFAVLGDELQRPPFFWTGGPYELLHSWQETGYRIAQRQGVLLVAPLNRQSVRKGRTDRTVLQAWINIAKNRALTLKEQMRFSLLLPNSYDGSGLIYGRLDLHVAHADWNSPLFNLLSRLPRDTDLRLAGQSKELQWLVRQQLRFTGEAGRNLFLGAGHSTDGKEQDGTEGLPNGIPCELEVRLVEWAEPSRIRFDNYPYSYGGWGIESDDNEADEHAEYVQKGMRRHLRVLFFTPTKFVNQLEFTTVENMGTPKRNSHYKPLVDLARPR